MSFGSTPLVHQTLQVIAIIAAAGITLSLLVVCVGFVGVILHDGNTPEVTAAMQILGQIAPNMLAALAAVIGVGGGVSAFALRSQNASTPNSQPPQ